MDTIQDIIKKIESNVKISITKNGKISFQTIGGRRYLQVTTPIGVREFRSMEQLRGAALLIKILSESSPQIEGLLYKKEITSTSSGAEIPFENPESRI